MLRARKGDRTIRSFRSDAGQTMIFVLLALSIFLVGLVGFAVDMTNLWFHRQMAQGAADASCQAGAMDLLYSADEVTLTGAGAFALPTSGSSTVTCSPSTVDTPCAYARLNGYPSDTTNNLVSYTLYASGTSPSGNLPPAPPSTFAPVPFIQTNVTDHVKMSFSAVIPGALKSHDVNAFAICGLTLVTVPVPMIVLDPTRTGSLNFSGTGNAPKITITGGPAQSIQVNSSASSPSPAGVHNGNPTIDLSAAGPNGTGGIIGIFGTETQATAFAGFSNIQNPSPTTEQYVSPHPPINDPFALTPPPNKPATIGTSVPAPAGQAGCPAGGGACTLYTPGYYANGIPTVKNMTAIFAPGIYYLDGNNGMTLDANGIVLPCSNPCKIGAVPFGNGSGGTMFYFNGPSTLTVHSNPSGSFVGQQTSDGTYIGRPDGKGGSGTVPGLVFFQNRNFYYAQPNTGGGGIFTIVGSLYFHQCNSADGAGLGTNCSKPPAGAAWPDAASAYNDSYNLGGTSGGSTTVTGLIIVDRLILSGTPGVQMQLLPNFIFPVLKATMFR